VTDLANPPEFVVSNSLQEAPVNSAAKLRKRSVATLAASALIIGGVAPAAFAWTNTQTPNEYTDAAAASLGVIDSDRNEPGTQGAQAISAGATAQPLADTRFVLPSTWRNGDYIEFTVAAAGKANGAAASRINFTSQPTVNIDTKAYAANTHVANTSGAANTVGSVEDGTEQPFTGAIAPVAPTYTVSMQSTTGDAYKDKVRITFTNDSKGDVQTAKFIGSINGAKVDVGASLTGDVSLTASAYNAGDVAPTSSANTAGTLQFFDETGANAVTYPATIAQAKLEVASSTLVADGTSQTAGPITVTRTDGSAFGVTQPIAVTADGVSFDTTVKPVATFYKSDGTVAGTATPAISGPNNDILTIASGDQPANAVRVVISGFNVKAPRGTQSYSYSLTRNGISAAPAGSYLTATGNQEDITFPGGVTVSEAVATQVPKRLGGQDRYQTAVKIAEYDEGTNENDGMVGESDNVVIASGEGFADALSAGYLAATKDAQLILTRQGSLPQTDIEFLKNYGAKNVFIVGGTGSVSKAVEDQLRSMQAYDVQAKQQTQQVTVTRHDGNVAATSAVGAGDAGTATLNGTFAYTDLAAAPSPLVLSVTRDAAGAPTAVSASPGYTVAWTSGNTATVTLDATGQSRTVTIGTGTTTLNHVDDYTFAVNDTSKQVTNTVPVGGSVTDASVTEKSGNRSVVPMDARLTVTRIAGNNRFETNKKVNMYAAETAVNPIGTTVPEFGKPGRKTAIVANGMAPWDALAAGPLVGNELGANPIPVILSNGAGSMNADAAAQIGQMDIKHLLFVGDKGVLPDSLVTESNGRGVSVNRLGGASRWDTAKAVSEFALKARGASSTNTSPGLGFAASGTGVPFLTNGGSIDGSTGGVAQGAWADALAAGPSAARQRTIIALTDSEKLPDATKDLLTAHKADLEPVIALGLGGVVSTNVINDANAAVAN